MKKVIWIGGGAVAVIALVVAGIFLFVLSNLNNLVKTAVEELGSDATKTKVTLREADISLRQAKGALRGLTVGNPPGFKTDHALSLGEVSVTLDPASIGEKVIVLKEVIIARPQVTYEYGQGGDNLNAIKKNVAATTAGPGGQQRPAAGGQTAPGSAQAKKDEQKVIIENLYVRNGEVTVSASLLEGRKVSAGLPDIHMKDVGKGKGGATPAEVAQALIAQIEQSASKAVGAIDGGALLKQLEGTLKVDPQAIQRSLGGAAGGAASEGQKLLEQGGQGLRGIIGR
ncbi:MAG: hypothetical protein U1E97_03835 [Alphaproteobacteria bacterium]